ncbi:MAG: HlyD family secretion protein [Chromatiales bacterium]|jgi:membrane fusion protein, multidrug efflux system|nr:HlyD family secretion protein [Chromatiales bacterium]
MALISKRSLRIFAGFGFCGALALMVFEANYWMTHVYESGARVQTELTRMSSRVDGALAEVLVSEGAQVKRGDLLASLDDKDIRLQIDALNTDLALELAKRARLASERVAFERELQSKIGIKKEMIMAATVKHQATVERLQLTEKDWARLTVLSNKKLASDAQVASEEAKVLTMRSASSVSAAAIKITQRELEQVEATREQLTVIDDNIAISAVTTERIQAMIAIEENSLGFRKIRSPINGTVARVFKYPGEFVEEGETIVILHDQQLFWLEAYIDEDQIRHVRVDQSVNVEFDAYPFEEFGGTVRRIGSATTLEMGISDGRGGQFGRASERVPVRISIDLPPPVLAPGMRADINIEIPYRVTPPALF